jgi:SdpC family antimicrobial peptide
MHQLSLKRSTALAGAVTAMLVTVLVACGNDDRTALAQSRQPLSGEEVFRGLVFHEGPVAAQLPEVWRQVPPRQLTPEQQEARARRKDAVVADIRQADPTFFDRFGADIQSGDHLRIEQALDESAKLVKQAAQKLAPAAPTAGDRQGTCCVVLVCGVVTMLDYGVWIDYGAIAAVIADEAYAYAESYDYNDGDGESAWAGTQLGRDQVVDMIATRLVAG